MIRACAYLPAMTVFVLRTRDDVLALRFALSPIWETNAAVRTFADETSRAYHQPWHRLIRERAAGLDLTPLLAVQPLRGFVPDFLTPPPTTAHPRLRDQLAEVRATPTAQVEQELERCRSTVEGNDRRRVLDSLLADPAAARDLLAGTLHEAWQVLVAPFWVRIRTLLDRDIDLRSRHLARLGFRRALDELHPRIRWTARGLSCSDGSRRKVELDERGLVLMPSAYMWPYVVAIAAEPWLPTIVYPARGIADLWRSPTPPPDALTRVVGRTRALVLAALDAPLSTTSLAALLELSKAGTSRHLLALRDAGLITAERHGHEVRYTRTNLGTGLLAGRLKRSPRVSARTSAQAVD
jgi:DNA-binding transcriptional ArsR family regulator